jgi:hypothetical protein
MVVAQHDAPHGRVGEIDRAVIAQRQIGRRRRRAGAGVGQRPHQTAIGAIPGQRLCTI